MWWHDIKEIKEWMDVISHRMTSLEMDIAQFQQKGFYKFEEYMRNADKLNGMINEFKGCVVLARGAIADRKDANKEYEELNLTLKNMIGTCQKHYIKQRSLDHLLEKIDFIHQKTTEFAEKLQFCEKKSPKKRKSIKKTSPVF